MTAKMVPLKRSPVDRPKVARIQESMLLSIQASGSMTPTAITEPGTAKPKLDTLTAPRGTRRRRSRSAQARSRSEEGRVGTERVGERESGGETEHHTQKKEENKQN